MSEDKKIVGFRRTDTRDTVEEYTLASDGTIHTDHGFYTLDGNLISYDGVTPDRTPDFGDWDPVYEDEQGD